MSQYQVSETARSDLDEICSYIAQDDPDAADKFILAIASRFPLLASMPEIGRQREELVAGLRSFPVGNYIIFYRVIEQGVEIARVLHGARDFPPLFE
jgi:toxin ParE1/3/4